MLCLFKLIKTLQFLLLFLFLHKWKEIFRKEIKHNTSLLGTSNWSMRHSKNCRLRPSLQPLRRPNSSKNTAYGPSLESRPSKRRSMRVSIHLSSRRSPPSEPSRISGWCTSTCEDQQQCLTAPTFTFSWKESSQCGKTHSYKKELDSPSRCQKVILPSIGRTYSWPWSENRWPREWSLA